MKDNNHLQDLEVIPVKTVEELAHLAAQGVKVWCPSVSYLEKPREAKIFIERSGTSILKMIQDGLFYHSRRENNDEPPSDEILKVVHQKIRSLGLSEGKLGKKLGISSQGAGQFLRANSVTTKTIDKYLKALDIKIHLS